MFIFTEDWLSYYILVVLMASFHLFLPAKGTDVDFPTIEKSFHDHYTTHGELLWVDFKQAFCRFMRPTALTLLKSELDVQDVILATQEFSKIKAQILACFYGATEPRMITEDEWLRSLNFFEFWYVRGPNGKYYEMRPEFEDFVIRQEVDIPPRDIEKLFYDYYKEHGELKWPRDRRTAFCEFVFPTEAITFLFSTVDTKDVTLVSLEYTKIKAELIDCGYQLSVSKEEEKVINGFGYRTLSYATGPNGKYYEMRQYDIRITADVSYAIFQEVSILPLED